MELVPRGSVRWFAAANETVEASGKLGDVATLRRLAEVLRGAPAVRDTLGGRVTATANAAFQLFSHGEPALAQILLDLVERAAPEVDEPGILARIYQARSSRSMITGDSGAYLESEQAAATAFERAGDLRYACMQRGHVGYACLEIGAWADAERALRDALEQGMRLGLHNVVATAKHNLGRALQMRGDLVEAATVEAEAVQAFDAQGDRRLAGAARLYLGNILLDQGEHARALVEVEAALTTAQPPMQPQGHACLARVLLRAGRPADALEHAQRANAILDELGAIEEGEALVRLVLAEALTATGDPAAARTVISRARDRLLARAEKISDPEWRKSFLENLPEHARTIALANELGR